MIGNMKTHLLTPLAGAALIAAVSVAEAGEPMVLSENHMDQVTAGEGAVIINGVAVTLPAGVNIETRGNVLIITVSGLETTLADPKLIITVSGNTIITDVNHVIPAFVTPTSK